LKHDLSIENIVLIVAVVMCLVWTYQSVVAMERNWVLTDRLNTERRELQLLDIEVEMAELENEYYRSDEYQELLARKSANKQLPGEHMVYLPENSEEAKNKHVVVSETEKQEKKEYSNFEKWLRYLFPNK
jgi:hypothetical protein